MVDVLIKFLHPNATAPHLATPESAGHDLHACIDEDLVLRPAERSLIPTGIAIELPVGYEGQVRSRSGLAVKNGVTVVNAPGTIDSDYRGEIKVGLINLGQEEFVITPNMRIAQLVISRYERATWVECDNLTQTKRHDGGFGSTGR